MVPGSSALTILAQAGRIPSSWTRGLSGPADQDPTHPPEPQIGDVVLSSEGGWLVCVDARGAHVDSLWAQVPARPPHGSIGSLLLGETPESAVTEMDLMAWPRRDEEADFASFAIVDLIQGGWMAASPLLTQLVNTIWGWELPERPALARPYFGDLMGVIGRYQALANPPYRRDPAWGPDPSLERGGSGDFAESHPNFGGGWPD